MKSLGPLGPEVDAKVTEQKVDATVNVDYFFNVDNHFSKSMKDL